MLAFELEEARQRSIEALNDAGQGMGYPNGIELARCRPELAHAVINRVLFQGRNLLEGYLEAARFFSDAASEDLGSKEEK